MLKLGTKCCISAFKCTRFESNYSSCKGRRSENLCNNSGGAQGKKKDKVKLRKPSKFPEFQPPLNANVLFCMFFFNLTLCMTKLRVLVQLQLSVREKLTFVVVVGLQRSEVSKFEVGSFFFFKSDWFSTLIIRDLKFRNSKLAAFSSSSNLADFRLWSSEI